MDDFVNKEFVQSINSADSLLQKELIILHSEEGLLQQRLHLMKEFVNDLPSSDPQYNMIQTAIQMDQIELDELSIRKATLLHKFGTT